MGVLTWFLEMMMMRFATSNKRMRNEEWYLSDPWDVMPSRSVLRSSQLGKHVRVHHRAPKWHQKRPRDKASEVQASTTN